jgi:hypothetical protein
MAKKNDKNLKEADDKKEEPKKGEGPADAKAKADAKDKDADTEEADGEEDTSKKDGDAGDSEKHDDEKQDVALIKKMIAEYLGDDEAESEEVQAMAKEAYQAYTEMGYEADEAMKAAGHSMKLAKHMASKETKKEAGDEDKKSDDSKKMDKEECGDDMKDKGAEDKKTEAKESEESESKESETKESDDKEQKVHKESSGTDVIKMSAEIASLKERLKKVEVKEHMTKVLMESGLPRSATALFKEKAGSDCSSIKDVDSKFKLFKEAYIAARGSVTDGLDFIVSSEKNEEGKTVVTFEDCVN